MLVSEEKAATIRDQLHKEQKAWHHKPRYGLFSYLPNHGFGFRENTHNTVQNYRDETGKVMTAAKNFQAGRAVVAGRVKTAHSQMDAFTKTGYLCNNDEYIDPTSIMKYREGGKARGDRVSDASFRPSGGNFYKVKAPYKYMSDEGRPDEAGPRQKNFVTSPMKKGRGNTTSGHLFSTYSYMNDPYEYGDMLNTFERRQHADKKLHGAFQTTFKKRDHFTVNRKVYHTPEELQGDNLRPASSPGGFKPFLNTDPIRKGYNRTINRFPKYAEEGPNQPENKSFGSKTTEGFWLHTYKDKSVPTPSVQNYNATNRPRRRF